MTYQHWDICPYYLNFSQHIKTQGNLDFDILYEVQQEEGLEKKKTERWVEQSFDLHCLALVLGLLYQPQGALRDPKDILVPPWGLQEAQEELRLDPLLPIPF